MYVCLFSFSLSLSRVHSHPIFFAQYLRLQNCCLQCLLATWHGLVLPRPTLTFTDLVSAMPSVELVRSFPFSHSISYLPSGC
jgi:hypothetical protein